MRISHIIRSFKSRDQIVLVGNIFGNSLHNIYTHRIFKQSCSKYICKWYSRISCAYPMYSKISQAIVFEEYQSVTRDFLGSHVQSIPVTYWHFECTLYIEKIFQVIVSKVYLMTFWNIIWGTYIFVKFYGTVFSMLFNFNSYQYPLNNQWGQKFFQVVRV